MKKIFLAFSLCISFQYIFCQKVKICSDSIQSSFRGLSVVNNMVLWVSGSNGTVGRSVDGGKKMEMDENKRLRKNRFQGH
ncbi:MAG: hypothetical protein KGM16_17415 [Bacteroidota bacterium]|nr:hypothetical protein [Bacteroidota bacterium]